MNLSPLLKRATKVLSDNSSVILTGAAVAGTVTTAIFSAKGHAEALLELQSDRRAAMVDDHPMPRTTEYIKGYYRHYIPAAVSGTTTIACIIGIHSVNTRRQAALISAYSVVDKAFSDYREKVVETIGENQEKKVRDEVAKDRLHENPVENNQVYITGAGEALCFDTFSGRYFKSDKETIRRAMNDVNAEAINNMYCSHNEFYEKIGLERNLVGEEFGWNTTRLMEVSFSSHLAADGTPCLSLDYIPGPIRNYWKV